MSPEKRQYERVNTLLTVNFKQPEGKTGYSLGISRSFSFGGLSFDSQNYILGPGEVLECTLKYPNSDWFASVRGEIIWKKESWYKCVTGLKFIDMDEGVKSKIVEFISLNKNVSETGHYIRYDDALSKASGEGSIARAFEIVTADSPTASEIPPKIEETAHISPDEIKTIITKQKQTRTARDRVVRTARPKSSRQQKKIRNVMLVVALFVLTSAGVLFFISEPSIKNIEIITPKTSLVVNAGHSGTDDLSVKPTSSEQTPTTPAEDGLLANSGSHLPPVATPDNHRIETAHHAPELPVQRLGDEAMESPTESPVGIKTDAPRQIVKKPEKIKEIQPRSIESAAKIKSQTGTKDIPVLQNTVPDHPVEDEMPDTSSEKSRLYEDSFNDNANGWDIFNTSMAAARLEHGEYHIQNKRKTGAHIMLHRSDFPFDSDFTIETSIRLVRSTGDYSYGLVLGAENALNNYIFQVNTADSYSIRQYSQGAVRELKAGKITASAVMQNSLNTLKVVKQGVNVRFYINDAYVDEVSISSFNGKKLGFVVDGESEIAVTKTLSRIVE